MRDLPGIQRRLQGVLIQCRPAPDIDEERAFKLCEDGLTDDTVCFRRQRQRPDQDFRAELFRQALQRNHLVEPVHGLASSRQSRHRRPQRAERPRNALPD